MSSQTFVLLLTLAAMVGLPLGYGLGWLVDPRNPPRMLLGFAFLMLRIERSSNRVRRDLSSFLLGRAFTGGARAQ